MITSEHTAKQMRKWLKALRSGKYKQTISSLQDRNGYCCLGVACEVFIPNPRRDEKRYIYGSMPSDDQLDSPQWLKDVDSMFERYVNLENSKTGVCLVTLNDSYRWNFTSIADAVEATLLMRPSKRSLDLMVKAWIKDY